MTRTEKIVGLITALVLTFGSAALATAPDLAQATEEAKPLALRQEVTTLKQEVAPVRFDVAMVDAQIQGFPLGDVSVVDVIDLPFNPECIGLSDALMVDGGARSLCR
jgi:hypothetical protein